MNNRMAQKIIREKQSFKAVYLALENALMAIEAMNRQIGALDKRLKKVERSFRFKLFDFFLK